MTKKIISLASLALAGLTWSWSASAEQILWCGATNPFNDSACYFTAFEADNLTSIAGPGTYTAYQVDEGTTFFMDLFDGTNWVNVWTVSHTPSGSDRTFDINSTIAPFSFSKISVSGIRFYSDELENPKEYKKFDMTDTVFTFACVDCAGGGDDDTGPPDDDTTPVPEPGTLALLGIGLAGLGLSRRRGMKKI